MERPAPRDIVFFLRDNVFPHLSTELLEEVVLCSKILYLPAGGCTLEKRGLYIVFSGSITVKGLALERGDYIFANAGGDCRAERETILIYVPPTCTRGLLEAGAQEPCRIGDLVYRRLVTVDAGSSIADAVRVMASEAVSSVVVVDGDGRPIGIFTDTDLRRVVASGVSLEKPVASVMTPNPLWMPDHVECSRAVAFMMEHNIKHLLVRLGSGGYAVVTVRDIAYAEALGPLYAKRIISAASSPKELRNAFERLKRLLLRLARSLHPLHSKLNPTDATAMASLALREALKAAARMAARRLGVKGGWAYIVLGSNARLEQVLPTDRDTMLLYNPDAMSEARASSLAENVEDTLDSIGFPGCSHGYTARSLVYSIDELAEVLRYYASNPRGDREVVMISLLMDSTAAYGDEKLASIARREAVKAAAETGSAHYLSEVMAAYKPRFSLGRLPRTVDVKADGLASLALAVKAIALREGVWEPVATIERIEALAARRAIPVDLAESLAEASRVLLGFAAWLRATRASTRVDTKTLSGVERSLLLSALKAVARIVDKARGGM